MQYSNQYLMNKKTQKVFGVKENAVLVKEQQNLL